MVCDFESKRTTVSMAAIAREYVELREVGHELHGPCPFCGGDDRFMVFRDDDRCFCRRCEFKGDAFDLIAAKEGISLAQAFQRVTGSKLPRRAPYSGNRDCYKEQHWQDSAIALIEKCLDAFVTPSGVSPAWRYLHSRGIEPATMTAFKFGFLARAFDASAREGEEKTRPAVLIPWILGNGLVCAAKWRYVDDLGRTDRNRRIGQKGGGSQILFGAHLCRGGPCLLVIEGEINAASVYQACQGQSLDVVSCGSESNGIAVRAAHAFALERNYRQVALWCDSPNRCQILGTRFEGMRLTLMTSPNGLDANDILNKYGPEVLKRLVNAQFLELHCSHSVPRQEARL